VLGGLIDAQGGVGHGREMAAARVGRGAQTEQVRVLEQIVRRANLERRQGDSQ